MHRAPAALMEVASAQAGLERPSALQLRGSAVAFSPAFTAVSLCCAFKANGGGTKLRIQRDSELKRALVRRVFDLVMAKFLITTA